jgi:hypothetical protein
MQLVVGLDCMANSRPQNASRNCHPSQNCPHPYVDAIGSGVVLPWRCLSDNRRYDLF